MPEADRPLHRRRDRRRAVHLAPPHARRGQPRLRADGGAGRHPQRHRVRLSRSSCAATSCSRPTAREVLPRLPDGAFELIYIDPPWGTGATRRHRRLAVDAATPAASASASAATATRARRSARWPTPTASTTTSAFLAPKLARARELLAPEGTLYVHLDYREAHYVKVALDAIFGRDCFLNEIIWAYDYGAKPTRRWPAKHDTILVYVRDRERYLFDADAVEREPYMAPGLVGPEKAARGKRPTDTWWHTIVATGGPRADRLPDAEARGRAAADRRGLLAAGRLVP